METVLLGVYTSRFSWEGRRELNKGYEGSDKTRELAYVWQLLCSNPRRGQLALGSRYAQESTLILKSASLPHWLPEPQSSYLTLKKAKIPYFLPSLTSQRQAMDMTRFRKRQVFPKGEVKGEKGIGPQFFCPKGPPILCGNLFPITPLCSMG